MIKSSEIATVLAGQEVQLKVWQIAREWSIAAMEKVERPESEPGPGQIVIRMRAASLKYRDLLTVLGKGGAHKPPLIPFSDGAGEMVAAGEGVTRVSIGDRVPEALRLMQQASYFGKIAIEFPHL